MSLFWTKEQHGLQTIYHMSWIYRSVPCIAIILLVLFVVLPSTSYIKGLLGILFLVALSLRRLLLIHILKGSKRVTQEGRLLRFSEPYTIIVEK